MSEGGLKFCVFAGPSLLYQCSYQFSAIFLRTRVSQWEQKTLKAGLEQLSSSLAWMALSSVQNYTSALFLSWMKMTLVIFPKLEKMLCTQLWSQGWGRDLTNSTLEGLFSSRNCSELGLTRVFDLRRFISALSSHSLNSELSRASSLNCSSMSSRLLRELFSCSLECLADSDSDLYLAEVELWSWSFSMNSKQFCDGGSQKGVMQSWKVLLRLGLCQVWSCCCWRARQLTPPRLSFWKVTCLSLERKMLILLPSQKTTLLFR